VEEVSVATSRSSAASARFDQFHVDFNSGELVRSGVRVPIQGQPLHLLRLLLEAEGKVVTREEIRQALWPDDTFVDFELGVNTAVKKLRQALEDSAEHPRFIETLPRYGYRLTVPVEWVITNSDKSSTPAADGRAAPSATGIAAAPERSKSSSLRPWVAISLLSPIVIAVLSWALWRSPSRRTEVIEHKLTANSAENSVTSAAISPDGKYLAYADNTGMFLKLIRTGEVHSVPLPPNFFARVDDWFPDGSHLLVSREEQPGKSSLWNVSTFGGPPRQLSDDASRGSVSPDGTHIAFLRVEMTYDGLLGREEWVMRSDGTDKVKVAADNSDGSQVGTPTWSPDGKRIAYIRTKWAYDARTSAVEVNEWRDGTAEALILDGHLTPALHWLPDGRLIYGLGNQQVSSWQDSSLWMVSLQQSGKISGTPKPITQGHGRISQVTGSADGKLLIFRSDNWSASVYIGTLGADGTQLLAKRRLTLDERVSIPFSWTPDSKAVLFNSDRNGTPEIFKQATDQPLAESLVTGAEQLSQPRVTPDGLEILYISTPKSPSPETPSSIFAIPISGGTSRLILKDVRIWNVQCARLPSTICLYSISKGNTSETFRFDLKNGKSADPPQIDPDCNWSLSPDGSQRAVVAYGSNQGTIQLRSTSTGKSRDLIVEGWNGLMSAAWSANGQSLLATWHNHEWDSALLHVTLDGRASVLLHSSNDIWGTIPSPDGRFLAIAEASGTKNIWQIENF
jgi:DNA-binding winged helix-turn-helix (wHTH) protein/Tol biopolymer transport system component